MQAFLLNEMRLHNKEMNSAFTNRTEIAEEYKWNLTDIYKSDNDWEKDFNWVKNQLPEYRKFLGKLSSNAENLLACFKFDDEISIKLERLYLYAMLSKDSDMSIPKYQAMEERIKSLHSKASAESSFIRPELLEIPDEKLLAMVSSNENLKIYQHVIDDLLRTKTHSLSKPEEQLLALAGEISQNAYNSYSMFTNADLRFGKVKDDSGNEIEITHARFYAAMYSKDRSFREKAFKSYLLPYKEYMNTFTTMFNGSLKTNIFFARARKYNSAREAALDRNNIPLSVYDNLVDGVNKNLASLHRWADLKKKLLSIDKLKPYDVYVSVFQNKNEKNYPYPEAKKIVCEALKDLGDDYLSSLTRAFDNCWIDVYESKAKKSGAYSSGTTYGVHPYVLLNWTDLLNDVFTLAHEMGHNMHSYYTGKTQPFPYANYSIFVAEVASTFNEALLLDYLIKNADDKDQKLFLLEKYLNNITATFYRQVMFAEFEMIVYDKTEKGEALTGDTLSELYKDIYQKYWGEPMHVEEEEKFTWARIPHFYYNFYVYQYATGFAASEVLANKVKTEGEAAVKKYLNFLKSGSSDYPINILKEAGVDMNSIEPVLAVSAKMDEILSEIENLIADK